MNKNMILEYYWDLLMIVMNDDCLFFIYRIDLHWIIHNDKYDGVQRWWSE